MGVSLDVSLWVCQRTGWSLVPSCESGVPFPICVPGLCGGGGHGVQSRAPALSSCAWPALPAGPPSKSNEVRWTGPAGPGHVPPPSAWVRGRPVTPWNLYLQKRCDPSLSSSVPVTVAGKQCPEVWWPQQCWQIAWGLPAGWLGSACLGLQLECSVVNVRGQVWSLGDALSWAAPGV